MNLTQIYKEEIIPQKYKIYQDLDGCLSDFDARFEYFSGMSPKEYEQQYGKTKFWNLIDDKVGENFWSNMPWMPDGKELWGYIKKYNPKLLSAPSRDNSSRIGKRKWVEMHIPGTKLILSKAENKKDYARPNSILIDDNVKNIADWIGAGGIGILHTSAEDTIKQLKKLGL